MKKYLQIFLILLFSFETVIAQSANNYTSCNFNDSIIKLRQAMSAQSAVDSANATFHLPPAGPNSIWINKDAPYNNYTPEQLLKDVFVKDGECLISNVTFKGLGWNQATNSWVSTQPRSLAYFSHGTLNGLGMETGLLMTTGNALDAVGPNNSPSAMPGGITAASVGGETDLSALIPAYEVKTITTLEFDFMPFTNTISFDYIFASEEYPEFSCSNFNDVFGFFISGPGINGPYTNNAINVATLPGTNTPVAIRNVHPTYSYDCPSVNIQYYVDGTGNAYMEFDGRTRMLYTAPTTVIPGSTYHLKLAVANVGDESYGSGVFLRAGSLDLGLKITNFGAMNEDMDNAFEDCENKFTINLSPNTSSIVFNLSYSGTEASNATKPNGDPLPTVVIIPPNTSAYEIPYIVHSPITSNAGTFIINAGLSFCPNENITKTINVFKRIQNPQFNIEPICGMAKGIVSVTLTEGTANAQFSVDDENIWHRPSNFSPTLNSGYHTIIFKDSISCHIDTFYVNVPNFSLDFDIMPQIEPICANNNNFVLKLSNENNPNSMSATNYEIIFDNQTVRPGFDNFTNQSGTIDASNEIFVQIPNKIYPDYYNCTIILSENVYNCPSQSIDFTFSVLYPDSIMQQKWDDVIALLNYYYNGGFELSSYQWYKNGSILAGETKSYIYLSGVPLKLDDKYSVLITRPDGSQMFSCYFTPHKPLDPFSEFPTVVSTNSIIRVPLQDKTATVRIITATGIVIASQTINEENNEIISPQLKGIYLLEISGSNSKKVIKIIVK